VATNTQKKTKQKKKKVSSGWARRAQKQLVLLADRGAGEVDPFIFTVAIPFMFHYASRFFSRFECYL
jgi:hypothetical protein